MEETRLLQGGLDLFKSGSRRGKELAVDGVIGNRTQAAIDRFLNPDTSNIKASFASAHDHRAKESLPPARTKIEWDTPWGPDRAISELNYKPEDRRRLVEPVMGIASELTGINKKTLGGIWQIESGCGEKIVSASNCMGSWQFNQRTFAAALGQHGKEVAAQLRTQGLDNLARQVEEYSADMKEAVKNGRIWGGKNTDPKVFDEKMQALRMDPRVSTLLAANVYRDNAKILHLDPNDPANAGILYAAYNLGVGNVKKLVGSFANDPDAMAKIGPTAAFNKSYFVEKDRDGSVHNLTGREVLEKYTRRMTDKMAEYETVAGRSDWQINLGDVTEAPASSHAPRQGLTAQYTATP
ncbi:MAG: hypothetical protein HY370_01595 [Proteobacteria bacterium]|nr:hypothetical protein [Pseudomonadota bacterium]